LVAKAAIVQFNSSHVEIRRYPYVTEEEDVAEVVEEAKKYKNSAIICTIVIPNIRKKLLELAESNKIPILDIMGPMMDVISSITNISPKLEPGLVRRVDEDYFKKIEAIEFAVKYDDGKDPRGLAKADVVLVGVSRTSKTPLAMYLAHKRLKVANLPLVPEVRPPEELFRIDPRKVVGLTIQPEILYRIRQERLKALGLSCDATYASMERILKELEYADKIMKKIGCHRIDVSNKAVEEVAAKILEIINKEEEP